MIDDRQESTGHASRFIYVIALLLCGPCFASPAVLSRNGAYVAVEAYAPNIVRVTIATDYATAATPPGCGFIADALPHGFAHGESAGGDDFNSSALRLHIDGPSLPAVPSSGERYFAPSLPPVALEIRNARGAPVLAMTGWQMAPHRVNGEATFQVGASFDAPADEHFYGLGQSCSMPVARSHGVGPTSAAIQSWLRLAGERELDLRSVLEFLGGELGVKRLLVEGGGGANGAFLRAGLIDEISVAICPVVDAARGAPSVFDSSDREADIRAPVAQMSLASCEVLDGGAVWLRYRLLNEGAPPRAPRPDRHPSVPAVHRTGGIAAAQYFPDRISAPKGRVPTAVHPSSRRRPPPKRRTGTALLCSRACRAHPRRGCRRRGPRTRRLSWLRQSSVARVSRRDRARPAG